MTGPVVTAVAVIGVTVGGLVVITRRLDPQVRRPCRCGQCRLESPLAPWKRRALAIPRPGPGWAARVRYGLREAEYAERARFGMAMNHPDWITGELPGWCEELLAAMDAELEGS